MHRCEYTKELQKWAEDNQIDATNIPNIKSLDLSNKKLHCVPSYILEFTSLESLNLSHNNLKELPKDITKLKYLKKLDISWNHIMDINFLPKNIEVNYAWNRL
ncbi:leucine-rich repeat domain-containing protein [Sulfurimonas sp.]|uniref:leucine-rich repeat domain-containing protein n=1 Tax=Sulfurimonas sp. TaxID=2022749 RepID=UPI003565B54D